MIVEHLFYTGAIAVIAGMVLSSRGIPHEKAYVLIIMVSSILPDIPWLFVEVSSLSGVTLLIAPFIPSQSMLHTLAALSIVSILAVPAFRGFHLRPLYVALCCALGYGSHLLADGLTHTTRYSLLWPISPEHVGIGLFVPYTPDILGLAWTRVLAVGLVLFGLAIAVRTAVEGPAWMRDYGLKSRDQSG